MANIKLNNNEYPIPDSALATLTADFVAHLGTITGSGLKVIIGGVEYGIDSDKMSDAISELETTLSDLQTPTVTSDRLLSFDNYILKDKNELYLIPKEGN